MVVVGVSVQNILTGSSSGISSRSARRRRRRRRTCTIVVLAGEISPCPN